MMLAVPGVGLARESARGDGPVSEAGPFARHGIRLPLALSENPDEAGAVRDASEPSNLCTALLHQERR